MVCARCAGRSLSRIREEPHRPVDPTRHGDEQPQPQHGPVGFLPLRGVRPRRREARLYSPGHQIGSRTIERQNSRDHPWKAIA